MGKAFGSPHIDAPDYEWLMIDASHCKVHPHTAGARSGNQDMSRSKGGSTQNCIWPWMRRYAGQGYYYTRYNSRLHSSKSFNEGITAEQLLADRGYDRDAIVNQANQQGMQVVIPPRKNRKNPREYDVDLYKLRHLIENAFLHLKRWRGIATRYAKNSASFLAAVHIQCIAQEHLQIMLEKIPKPRSYSLRLR